MRRRLALAICVSLAAPGGAAADHVPLPNWPALLPPRTVPAQPTPAEGCPHPSVRCVEDVIREMEEVWTPLDGSCSPRAVFALTYLRTTEAFRDALAGHPFADEAWIIRLDRVFADLYFEAIRQYSDGDAPPAWRIAFSTADGMRTNGGQDVLLGMNAHIQRDLPVALFRAGLVGEEASRKPDHDRVNEILASVIDDVQDELAARYDPLIALSDASPSPVEEVGVLETIKGWREAAWRNAERLALAATAEELSVVMRSIEVHAETWARAIAAVDFSFYAASRSEYCVAAHAA